MTNPNSQLSPQIQTGQIPEEWQEKFILKRIDEEDIELTLQQRDGILNALNKGDRFIQIGKYTLMLNAIKSIDPKWGDSNIPPKPKEEKLIEIKDGIAVENVINQKEIDLWNSIFGKKQLHD